MILLEIVLLETPKFNCSLLFHTKYLTHEVIGPASALNILSLNFANLQSDHCSRRKCAISLGPTPQHHGNKIPKNEEIPWCSHRHFHSQPLQRNSSVPWPAAEFLVPAK